MILERVQSQYFKEAGVKKYLVVAAFVCLLLGQAHLGQASGFLIYEHGAAAMAMGGAFVAVANNPSAIFHNPAGIAFLKGTQVSVGPTFILPSGHLTLPNWPVANQRTWKQENAVFYPTNFYLTHSVGDRVTLGFGFFSPYGLGSKWPKENPLRYLGYEDDMKTFFFNPTIGIKLTDKFSVGFGVSYIYSTVKFKLVELEDFTAYHLSKYDVPAALDGNGHGWAVNAGALYRTDKFSIGVNWRGAFDIKYTGDLALDTSALPAPIKPAVPTTAKGDTTFKFPDILGVGVAFNPTDKLLLSADFHYVTWNRFDKYVVTFDDPKLAPMEVEENFKDSWLLRGGGQYSFCDKFALRLGILYDKTPQPVDTMDPLLPDANRVALTGGFGFKLSRNVILDVGYQYEVFSDRTAPNRNVYNLGSINLGEGTYDMTANLIGLSLSFVF
jgi:long-chain fatty acid transport protein